MSTNLVIGLPILFETLSSVTPSATFETSYPALNALSGSRSQIARLAAEATNCSLVFDTGSSESRTIDFLFVARAVILKAQGSKRLLLSGDLSGDICGTASDFQNITLYGRNSEDALFTSELGNSTDGTLSSTETNQEYTLELAGSGTCPSRRYGCSSVMFGEWFDFGRDVRYTDRIISERWSPNARSSYTEYRLVWRSISKTIKDAAVQNIFSRPDRGLILHTRDNHSLLLDRRVVHAFLDEYDIRQVSEGYFDVSATFREQV